MPVVPGGQVIKRGRDMHERQGDDGACVGRLQAAAPGAGGLEALGPYEAFIADMRAALSLPKNGQSLR